MSTLKRIYSQKTLKVLFAWSGNQCAHPECTETLIEPATEDSNVLVTGHICHIHAVSTDGPRGKPGLTQSELNWPENLLLLCRNHHALVDGQHETYPAELLREWKQTHESKMRKRLSTDLEIIQPEVYSHSHYPTALVDQKINDEVDVLRKSRCFAEFDGVRSSLMLGRRVTEAELSGGTDEVRSRALAWCARLLCRTDEIGKAEKYLEVAKGLGTCPEADIADAFITSQKGSMAAALRALAGADSTASRSAALMIVAHHEGAEGAIDWLHTAVVEATELDSDGKYFLLTSQLQLAHWDAARELLSIVTEQDLEEAPVLHHVIAITHLLSAVPVEFRALVLNQLPFDGAGFPLASSEGGMNARRAAQGHFADAAAAAHQLNCPGAAGLDDEYAIWLELKDPEQSENGRRRLQEELRDSRSALHMVPLGLQFGIKLDLGGIDLEIERQIALNGGITQGAAIARFALAFTKKSPEEVANYVAQHYGQLAEFLDKKALRSLQIEMFSRAGRPERARECLESLLRDGLSGAEEGRLRRVILEAEGADPVEVRRAQFEQSDELQDLASLVDELESSQGWEDLCDYCALLYERTRSVNDAERLATAFANTHRNERLSEFIQSNPDLLAQSTHVHMLYAWALYYEGALVESRTELVRLNEDEGNPNYRALYINLGMALGDWGSLSAFVADEHQQRNRRSALDLIGAAQLAFHLSSPHARDLLFAATEKASDDPAIFATAYLLATSAGWEGNDHVIQWLHKAAELSGEEGPLQQMSLGEIIELKPEWDRQESETWRMYAFGEIPMFLTARFLHKSLTELVLFPALANLAERDPRRRSIVPAYSGKRQSALFDPAEMTVGMDATALLTLSFMDLLGIALDAFKTIWLPHTTLAWLFEEKQKAAFHQPTRIKDAHRIRHFVATDVLGEFVPSTVAESDLAAQVGDELASFIAEAEKVRDHDGTQRIVVRPSPVYRRSSLMEEEADLTAHASVLSSCLALVDKLRQKGELTVEEEKRAHAFLQLNEKPWPDQPEIADGAILYLDHLAVTYFLHLGILDKIKAAGLEPIVSASEINEASALIGYESISDEVQQAIERIREVVSPRIQCGEIKMGRLGLAHDTEDEWISKHPTIGVIALANECDAIFSDDRFLNQRANVDDGASQAPIYSTLDLLDALAGVGAISMEDRLERRTLLRRAGYAFIPVNDEELACHLDASRVVGEKVVETAELKAIRENVLRIRMSDCLQLPEEAPWLDTTLMAFVHVLRRVWKDCKQCSDFAVIRARSNWLVDQTDVRGWAHSLGRENGDNVVKIGRGAHIRMLLTPPTDVPQEVKDAYWSWVEERVLGPVKEQFPDLYASMVERQRDQITEMADMELNEGDSK